jgi:hypothetical protein
MVLFLLCHIKRRGNSAAAAPVPAGTLTKGEECVDGLARFTAASAVQAAGPASGAAMLSAGSPNEMRGSATLAGK